MSRPKQEITKDKRIELRLETSFKNEYAKFCKKNKFAMAKRIRDLMIDDLRENGK